MRQRLYTKSGYSPKDGLTGGQWVPVNGVQRWVPEVSPAPVDVTPQSVDEIAHAGDMEAA